MPVEDTNQPSAIAGVILAGGRSRRFGSDKAAAMLGGETLFERVRRRAAAQVESLAVSIAADAADVAADFDGALLRDKEADLGPLSGVAAGLEWAASLAPRPAFVATFPCDSPFFPLDLAPRLVRVAQEAGASAAVPELGGRIEAAFGLWSVSLGPSVRAGIAEGRRRLGEMLIDAGAVRVSIDEAERSAFFQYQHPRGPACSALTPRELRDGIGPDVLVTCAGPRHSLLLSAKKTA